MARKKKEERGTILDAIIEIEGAKTLSREYIIDSLKASLVRAYIKTFLKNWSDSLVRADVDIESGKIVLYRGKTVVETDDEITDDYIQVAREELLERGIDVAVGDLYEVAIPIETILEERNGQRFINSFTTCFKAKLLDAERKALEEIYGSKKGELITGRIEQYNPETQDYIVNIGKMNVILKRKDRIGDETFKIGQDIKLCIIDVTSSPKGATVEVSRSDPLFLKRLFELEISEVYDGTVIIKNIARRAGERAKVAVYSNDPEVDPCGSCIGLNGSRIQNITQYLGNGREKEKIDVVKYDPIDELYIVEALVPGTIIGIATRDGLDDRGNPVKIATVITKQGDVQKTVGKKGINAFLAYKLTGYKIEVKEIDDALREGIIYTKVDDIRYRASIGAYNVAPKVEEEVIVEPVEEVIEEIVAPAVEEEVVAEPVEEVVEEVVAPIVEPVVVKPVKEEPVQVETPKEPEVQIASSDVVKMDDLLSKLEEEKAAAEKANKGKKPYKKKEEKVEVVKEEVKNVKGMAIYTDEELEELRRQEELEEEEESYGVDIDDDYDEYDSDDYYED